MGNVALSLPTPGGDSGTWGDSLNAALNAIRGDYLSKTDGVAKANLAVNVNDYGADPTGLTDSWTATSNAISAAGTSREVFFGPGTYSLLGGGLPWLAGQRIRGCGPGVTTLVCNAGATGALLKLALADQAVEDLTIDMSASTAGAYGIRFEGCSGSRVNNVEIKNAVNGGFYVAGTATDVALGDIEIAGCKFGIVSVATAVVDGFSLRRFLIDGGGAIGDGIEFNLPSGSLNNLDIQHGHIRNFTSNGTDGIGIGISGAGGRVLIAHVIGESLGLDGVHIDPGGTRQDIHVHDTMWSEVSRAAVTIQSDTGIAHEGINVHDNTARACLTGYTSASAAGVFEFAGGAGTVKGSSFRANRAFDCGTAGEDTIGVLLGSTSSFCRATESTVARQAGTAASGSSALVDAGTSNVTDTPITY